MSINQNSFETDKRVFPTIKTEVISQFPLGLNDHDRSAIDDILSWRKLPSFLAPGRTAWYRLQYPFETEQGFRVEAAKIKGVGGWNPTDFSERSGMRGSNPDGLQQPSNTEYASDIVRSHFGINTDGEFCVANSEPAPFGGIVHARAKLEHENAAHLLAADVPTILPYMLVDYPGQSMFRNERLSSVVSLAPTLKPSHLEALLFGMSDLDETGQQAIEEVIAHYSNTSGCDAAVDRARCGVATEIGSLIRRMNASGLFRYSSSWDNFIFDCNSKRLVLTDLDSTRPIESLAPELRGLQQLRDLASALFRLAQGLQNGSYVFGLRSGHLRKHDPFAALVSGYFGLPIARGRQLVEPIWRYVTSDGVLESDTSRALAHKLSHDLAKPKLDPNLFCCVAILSLAEQFYVMRDQLKLQSIPEKAVIEQRVARFLGPKHEIAGTLVA